MKKKIKKLKKKIKKYKKIIFSSILILIIIISFFSYKILLKQNIQYIILDDGLKFFPLDENQKIIRIIPEKELNDGQKKPEEYEIYKLPKYNKNSNKKHQN
jgi:hypothetical protein